MNLIQRRLSILLFVTFAACVIRLWMMPMRSSLWVDEMGSVFVLRHGANDPSFQTAPQVPQSIYYVLPELAAKVAGDSEVSYRLSSLVAMAGATLMIALLAGRLFSPMAAWLAVFACMASHGFNYQAADARPYALGTFILSAALLLLVRWLDSGRARDATLFVVAASLLWWVHLIFWPFYIVFVIYAAYRMRNAETRVTWQHASLAFGAVACAILPVASHAVSLLHHASSHVVATPPSLGDLLTSLKPGLITGACALAVILSRRFRWPQPATPVSRSSIVLILSWWLVDPICLFVFSRLTGNSVFLPRYLYLALPGVALTACLIVALTMPFDRWDRAALALGIGVLVFGGQWNHLWPAHHNSNWRLAASQLQAWEGGQRVPVIAPSPFIEARPPVWHPDLPPRGFLYSHLLVYDTPGRIYPFPFETSPEAERYAHRLANGDLERAGRFAIYGGDRNVRFWRQWFAAQPEFARWRNRKLGSFGDVEIAVFWRDAPATQPVMLGNNR